MPEGDTIHRTARTLDRVLGGQRIEDLSAPRLVLGTPLAGRVVSGVEARGKHLLVRFDDGRVLHSHLGMPGSWHVYRPGERWQRRDVRARIAVPQATAVCFGAPVVELLDAAALRRHPVLRRLGPDLCTPDPNLEAATERIAELHDPGTTIGEVLLDQRVAAGIGNVYRSEICFLQGVHPETPIGALTTGVRRGLLARGAELLRANLMTSRRTTVPGGQPGSLFVYGRAGRGCRRCATPIELSRPGDQARMVFWCPSCQPRVPRSWDTGVVPSQP